MAITLNSNLEILAPFNLDAKYGVWSGADINTAKANALAGVASGVRAIGMTVGLYVGGNTTEYWFKSGTTNADLVEKILGSSVSSGNLITVASGGQIDFTGGTNTQEVIVENSSAFPFIFTADDDVDNLTFQGNANNGNIRLSFNTIDAGQVYFNFGTSPSVSFTSEIPNTGSISYSFEDSNSHVQTGLMNVSFGINPDQSVTLDGYDLAGVSEVNLNLYPATSSNGSFINYSQSHLHFAFFDGATTTEVARFGGNANANFLVYNNMTVGANTAPSNAILDVHQTGNTKANLRLTGLATSDNARLDFSPFSGSNGIINNSTGTSVFFWTNGSGTSYYSADLFYFGSNRVQIDNALTSNQSSLLVDPTYSSTGNSAITISGSSTRATTRGLNIIHSYTGATSNAIYVGSAISASSNLANAVNYNPTLTATANNDYLISLEVSPTFVSGAFTNVQNTAIRTISGSNLFNTLSGNTIIGSGGDSGNAKLDVYGRFRAVSNSVTTGAIATITGTDAVYGLRVNVERVTSSVQFGVYSRIQGTATTGVANYGVYGESFGGGLNYGGYFVGNGNSSANRIHIGVLGEALNYNGTSTVSGVGGFFQVSTSIASGTAIPIIGNVTSDTAPTGTLKYLDLRLAGTSQFFVERNANKNRPAMMIGGTTIDNSAIIQADSTTQGVLFPRMTTTQKNGIANVAGLVIYDTTLNKLCVNNGSGWETITSS